MEALYRGSLVVHDRCVLIGGSGDYTVPIWHERRWPRRARCLRCFRHASTATVPCLRRYAPAGCVLYGVAMETFDVLRERLLDQARGPIELKGVAYPVPLFRAAPW